MQQQEMKDDADLKAIKEKAKNLKDNMPSVEKKDDLIKHLMARLNQADTAINESETIIQHERANRKRLSQDIKKANKDLRDLVESESKNLRDKVHIELEKHLEFAVKEKMVTEEANNKTKKDLDERNKQVEELQKMNKKYQDDLKLAQKLDNEQRDKIKSLEDQAVKTKEENKKVFEQNEERKVRIES